MSPEGFWCLLLAHILPSDTLLTSRTGPLPNVDLHSHFSKHPRLHWYLSAELTCQPAPHTNTTCVSSRPLVPLSGSVSHHPTFSTPFMPPIHQQRTETDDVVAKEKPRGKYLQIQSVRYLSSIIDWSRKRDRIDWIRISVWVRGNPRRGG